MIEPHEEDDDTVVPLPNEPMDYADHPSHIGLDARRLQRAYDVLHRFADDGRIPGGVALVGRSKGRVQPHAFGVKAVVPQEEPIDEHTVYDCASLTKIVVTAPLILALIDRGQLRLDDAVARFIPEFVNDDPIIPMPLSEDADRVSNEPGEALTPTAADKAVKGRITVKHLLIHTSGLPPWRALYEGGTGWRHAVDTICRTPLAYQPGTEVAYSCLGYILLGEIIQRVTGTPLDQLARKWIFQPLGMHDATYNPPPALWPKVAPTERKNANALPLRGVVHDENARSMGGVSGNAGLFATADDLAKFATMILQRGLAGNERIMSQCCIETSIINWTEGLNAARGLGWDIKHTHPYCSAGDWFSPASFGHTGFTGTSLWIDPRTELFVVLLTNRVHPTRENQAHIRLRPLFHNAVAAALI